MNYLAFIALVSALVATGAMSMDMYIPSFPGMSADLAASAGDVQLTMRVFLFGFAASQLVYGPLSDRFGRRRVLVWGMFIYAVASIACVFATSHGGWTVPGKRGITQPPEGVLLCHLKTTDHQLRNSSPRPASCGVISSK